MKARVWMASDLGLRTERLKGIDPSLSAWEAGNSGGVIAADLASGWS